MFKKMFSAVMEPLERRSEEAPNKDAPPDSAELFAGMDFVETAPPEENAAPVSPELDSQPHDEGLFSGLSMITDTSAPTSDEPQGDDAPKAPTSKVQDSMEKPPPPQNVDTPPPINPPSNPPLKLPPAAALSVPALRPAVVRKKKRSIRVGYAREGENEESLGRVNAPQSDGTPMSQSPRSSIGDLSELQLKEDPKLNEAEVTRGASESLKASHRQSPKEGGQDGTPTLVHESNRRILNEGSQEEVSADAEDLEAVARSGLIAVVPSSNQAERTSSEEAAREAERAAEQVEEERMVVESKNSVEEKVESETSRVTEGDAHAQNAEPETPLAVEYSKAPDTAEAEEISLPTAASLEKAGIEEVESIAAEQGTEKGALQRLETDLDIERIALEEQLQEEPPPTVESLRELPLQEQVAQVQQFVEKRLAIIREKVAAELSAKKAAVQRKREAAERAGAAAARLAELEQQVTDACEQEDFEQADELTREIEYVEREAAAATAASRAAEAESDSASTKVQATAQEEVAIELEGADLLRAVIASAHVNALRVQHSTEAEALAQEEQLQQQEDDVAERRRKVGLELRVIEEESAALKRKIDESTRDEVKQKEELLQEQSKIEGGLNELRAAVAAKERELAEHEAKVAEVEGKIAVVASKFGRELKGLQADEERVHTEAAQLEAELERVAEKRRTCAAAVEKAAAERKSLEETASSAEKGAAQLEKQARRKQEVAAAAAAAQRRKDELAEAVKRLSEETQAIRECATGLRASFQEVAVVKLRLQQELAAEEHKVDAADKRAPELEAEKKLAAQARNFKEAARLSAEAKSLATERDKSAAEVGRLKGELEAVEKDEEARAAQVAELEAELSAKEKEVATARCERLRLVAAAARREMDEAAEAEDFEEAGSLQVEAEAADAEAEQLKETYKLEGKHFEHVEDEDRGDPVGQQGNAEVDNDDVREADAPSLGSEEESLQLKEKRESSEEQTEENPTKLPEAADEVDSTNDSKIEVEGRDG